MATELNAEAFDKCSAEAAREMRIRDAAPELLQALQTIIRIGNTDYGPACAARMYDEARAAIAKATGTT